MPRAALDVETERIVEQNLNALSCTQIIIAHRLSTVMDMDRLIVLQRGVIVADGSHPELVQQGGLYAELWYRQSGEFNPAARHPPEPAEPAIPSVRVGGTDLAIERRVGRP